MEEEEEVSSTQWYPGKDCSVLVDVCGRTLWSGVMWDRGCSGNYGVTHSVSNFNANAGNVSPWKSAETPGEESGLHTICVCRGMFRGMSVSSVIGCCE